MELVDRLRPGNGGGGNQPPSSTSPSPVHRHAQGRPPPHPLRGQPSHSCLAAAAGAVQDHDYDEHDDQDVEPDQDHDQDHDHDHDHEPAENDPVEQKKLRACEACRGLKVRCEPDPNNDDAPCKRCSKAGRNCVVTMPTRKRRKKTDSRVAELEKKIDALTASLHARANPLPPLPPLPPHSAAGPPVHTSALSASGSVSTNSPGGEGVGSPPVPQRPLNLTPSDEAAGSYGLWGGPSRRWSGRTPTPTPPLTQSAFSQPQQSGQHREHLPAPFQPPMVVAGQKRKGSERRDLGDDERSGGRLSSKAATPTPTIFSKSIEGDIVDRGVITMDMATDFFARYKDDMVPHVPAVLFPAHTSVADLRKNRPVLFLSVMAVAASKMPALQRTLQRELMLLFAEKIFLTGEKSMELVQSLAVAVIWYWPPENYEELKFYQLVHMAAVMAIDIGLGKKPSAKRRGITPFNHPFRRQPPCDPLTIEARRTWLVCHFLCANTSIALRRPNLLRWTPFMSDCVEVLQSSPDAAPSDKYLCHLVWTHRQGEEVGLRFSLDDDDANVSINDSMVQHSLRAMELDAAKYRASVPADLMQPTLRMSFDFINLYMHEVALRSDTTWRPPFMTENLTEGLITSDALSSAQVNAFSACLDAVKGIFKNYLNMSISVIQDLPVYIFVRVAYAFVLLLKMYFSLTSNGGELGKIVDKRDLRVEYYLEALLEKFRAAAADDKCRPAAKFLVVLAMLRSWFLRQTQGDGGKDGARRPDSETPLRTSGSEDTSRQQSANTPLQLLSEVATSGNHPSASAPNPPVYSSLPSIRPPVFFGDRPSLPPPLAPITSSTSGSEADSATSGFPTSSAWMPSGLAADLNMGMQAGAGGGGFDGVGLGLGLGPEASQESYEDSVKMFMGMSEPWFNDVMQTLPDGNIFPF